MSDKKMTFHLILLIVFVFYIYVPSICGAQMAKVTDLISSIEPLKTEFRPDEPLRVKFTLTNASDKALNVLIWRTPLEGFNANIFQVKLGGKPVLYIGRTIKRAAPQPKDYVNINPKDSVSAIVDLSEAYLIYKADEYTVLFESGLLDYGQKSPKMLSSKERFTPKRISSNLVSFRLIGDRKRPSIPTRRAPKTEGTKKLPNFISCSQSQKDRLSKAHKNAKLNTGDVVKLLDSTDATKLKSNGRYVTWFGEYTSDRYSTVTSNYKKIRDALAYEQMTFNCGCNSNYYAYVYPSKPYEIFLCNSFWSAPETGTDSQFGTLIHETSHFYDVAGTDDHAYGHSSCKDLAEDTPSLAIKNADSHEYFSENTPPLDMVDIKINKPITPSGFSIHN